jgi:hypothetical protein
MSIYDTEFFFAPWMFTIPPEMRAAASIKLPIKMTYFPRVGFNLWNTKYFVLPQFQPFDHEERGVFTLVNNENGGPLPVLASSPPDKDDYVVIKNPEAFPRAWIVHQAELRRPILGLRRSDRTLPMEKLLYRSRDGGFSIWRDGNGEKHEYPLRTTVMLETYNPAKLDGFGTNAPATPAEQVKFVRYEPGRIEMEANLEAPGFLVLADTYFPGWKASVDGKETPIVRANRVMQAIPMTAGKHHVELWITSRSLVVGGVLSVASWLGLLAWYLSRRIARR